MARFAALEAGDVDRALRLYAWNAELTAAFWGPIACLEIVVRNAMHDALRAGRRDAWWDDPAVHLMRRERRAVDEATDAGTPRDPRFSYETALWQPRLQHAFPGLRGVRRKQLHRKLDEVRRFRNRLAHHEPIIGVPLRRVRDDILEVAGFVHTDIQQFIRGAHRIDDVLARRDEVLDLGRAVI